MHQPLVITGVLSRTPSDRTTIYTRLITPGHYPLSSLLKWQLNLVFIIPDPKKRLRFRRQLRPDLLCKCPGHRTQRVEETATKPWYILQHVTPVSHSLSQSVVVSNSITSRLASLFPQHVQTVGRWGDVRKGARPRSLSEGPAQVRWKFSKIQPLENYQ